MNNYLVLLRVIIKLILVGGEPYITTHAEALQKLLSQNTDILVVQANSENALSFTDL